MLSIYKKCEKNVQICVFGHIKKNIVCKQSSSDAEMRATLKNILPNIMDNGTSKHCLNLLAILSKKSWKKE